jgi:hypothetical protein
MRRRRDRPVVERTDVDATLSVLFDIHEKPARIAVSSSESPTTGI